MTFDWHMLYPLHTVILDNSQVYEGVPCRAQLCNFSKWFFSPRFGVVPIWELWQFCYVRIEPPKTYNIAQHITAQHSTTQPLRPPKRASLPPSLPPSPPSLPPTLSFPCLCG